MRSHYDVILKPIISEKSTALAEVGNKYVFKVAMQANKQEIRDAVQRLFNVKVQKVHTLVMHGELKRTARAEVKKSNWKKALVTLKAGDKIDFFQTK